MSAPHKEPPPSCAIVIFGANGDLTKRLIIPALYNLARAGNLPEQLALIGVDHNDRTSAQWQGALRDFLAQSLAKIPMGRMAEPEEIADAPCSWHPTAPATSPVSISPWMAPAHLWWSSGGVRRG